MDLKKLSLSAMADAFTFNLAHPDTGEMLDVKLSVVSAKSEKSLSYLRSKLRKEQQREMENARSRKPTFQSLDEIRQDSRDVALSRLVGWENLIWDGKPLEFNEENARLVLTECDWIGEQILEHSNDLGKFLTA